MTFLDAAESVLREAGKPMHVDAITDEALSAGQLETDGKTPTASMAATLAMSVKSHGDASPFVRTSPNTYGLREWLDTGLIGAQSQETEDGQRVRIPHFPTYAIVRAALPLLAGTAVKTATGMQRSLHSQMGNPQATKDWTDPDTWIPECLEGELAELATRLWKGSNQTLNPRHLRGTWLLMRRYDLLVQNTDGLLELGQRGQSFLESPGSEVERDIDDREGVFKILSLVAELGPARKGTLLEPWRAYMYEVSSATSDSYTSSALYARLRNLRDRGFVELAGMSYSITDEGLRWIDDADLDDAISGTDIYQKIVNLARAQKAQIRDTVHDLLYEMDPYAFEKLVAQLLANMGYDDAQVTPRGNDKGVDVVASIEMGITTVKEVIQVKRVRGNVQRPVLDALRGSLHRFRAERGTIITTSSFSKGSMDAARELGAAPITLIDGPKLVDLLIEHGIGVRKKPIDLWELDASAFSGEDEIAE